MIDGVKVDYFGQMTPLNQVGTISTPESRLIVIDPWDKSLIPIIEKEILKYVGKNIWINPDCGLKTRKKEQVFQALLNIRKAINKIEKENKKK